MRIAVNVRGVQTDLLHQLPHVLVPLGFRRAAFVDDQGLFNDLAYLHPRVQRGIGILEHDLHVLTQPLQLFSAQMGDRFVFIDDLTLRRLDQAQKCAHERRLSAAGLAAKAQCFAPVELEINAVDRFDIGLLFKKPLFHREPLPDPRGADQNFFFRFHWQLAPPFHSGSTLQNAPRRS